MRILGAVAVKLHCQDDNLAEKTDVRRLGQRTLSDLDFITYSKHAGGLDPVFVSLDFVPNERFNAFYGRGRRIYEGEDGSVHVDVFLDRLEFCHTIDFDGRLELDYPTITVSDILLQKLQIVKITEKDLKDMLLLLECHGVAHSGEESRDKFDASYISGLLSQDWGFYYTATTNFRKAGAFSQNTDAYDCETIAKRISDLVTRIEEAHKSLRWKLRAKVGANRIWYQEVEDVRR